MRLIDADELKKKIRRCDDSATRATFDYVYDDDIDDAPTVDVLDKIKDEIFNACSDNYHMPVYNLNCEQIFEIIDKYKS